MGTNVFPAARHVGVYRTLQTDPDWQGPAPVGTSINGSTGNVVSGFDEDGDYIALPVDETSNIEYWNETGTQVTSGNWNGGIAPAEINANCDQWLGFYKKVGDPMVIVAIDSTTERIYTATISKGGSISALGNFIPASAVNVALFHWGIAPTTTGHSGLYRDADAGNLFLRVYEGATGVVEIEISSTTGLEVTAKTVVAAGGRAALYKTLIGNYIGGFDLTTATAISSVVSVSGQRNSAILFISSDIGIPVAEAGVSILMWNSRIECAIGDNTTLNGKAFTVEAWNNWVDGLCQDRGLS